MQSQQSKKNITLSFYLKCGAVFFLLLLSVFIAACSGNGSSIQLNPGTPVATVTINLGQFSSSPTPPLKDYYCGGWATDTTPPYNPSSTVNVYGKFTHNVDGNPEGVGGASAAATVLWPDGSTDTLTATTTSDGLAVFPVAIKPGALNKEVLIQITFTTADGVTKCTIPQAAYFTAIMVSPTPTITPVPSPTNTLTPSPPPFGSPSPGPGTPTVTPTKTGGAPGQ